MFSKIRSLIFKLDPELAHNLAIKALKFNYFPINNFKKNSSIETEIFGKKISNPIGVAAAAPYKASVLDQAISGTHTLGKTTPAGLVTVALPGLPMPFNSVPAVQRPGL